ncbi:MAG: QueT transporter family protein [Clostridia bacterium]|nr:QueT transporter family protein [Clostridia bacterium]
MSRRKPLHFVILSALIAAVYAVLTLALWQFSSLSIQVRLSEALTVLPAVTFAAVPGVTLGCFIANLLAGNVIDAIFGTLATLIAAVVTYLLRKKTVGKLSLLVPLPTILSNALIIPFVLYYGYGFQDFLGFTDPLVVLALNALSVAIGEMIVTYLIGLPFLKLMRGFFASRREKYE